MRRRTKSLLMRPIVAIAFLLLSVGILSCHMPGTARAKPNLLPPTWVRTCDGWERPGSWNAKTVASPTLHPLVVATGQSLVSILALIAFQRDETQRR